MYALFIAAIEEKEEIKALHLCIEYLVIMYSYLKSCKIRSCWLLAEKLVITG